jgi:hypothetical protein
VPTKEEPPTWGSIREWIDQQGTGQELSFATFDTKVEEVRHLPRSAAKKAARALPRRGFRTAAAPMSFFVTDTPGPSSMVSSNGPACGGNN